MKTKKDLELMERALSGIQMIEQLDDILLNQAKEYLTNHTDKNGYIKISGYNVKLDTFCDTHLITLYKLMYRLDNDPLDNHTNE